MKSSRRSSAPRLHSPKWSERACSAGDEVCRFDRSSSSGCCSSLTPDANERVTLTLRGWNRTGRAVGYTRRVTSEQTPLDAFVSDDGYVATIDERSRAGFEHALVIDESRHDVRASADPKRVARTWKHAGHTNLDRLLPPLSELRRPVSSPAYCIANCPDGAELRLFLEYQGDAYAYAIVTYQDVPPLAQSTSGELGSPERSSRSSGCVTARSNAASTAA